MTIIAKPSLGVKIVSLMEPNYILSLLMKYNTIYVFKDK